MGESNQKKVVVIGAGFGGLQAVKQLSQNDNLDITVIDKKITTYFSRFCIKWLPQF
ncbi:pyridine nucleotide-disulfide oxidoreductase domain protein [Leptospira kirschneri str. 200801925]|nr:pyridine nucleotide-disulfide oxidoreductase domain protein [Leptospira kirschneri str. 200801925]